jgi:hypothetical protein
VSRRQRPPDADGVDALVLAARPADPTGASAEAVAVRVLARVAALETGGSSSGPSSRRAERAREGVGSRRFAKSFAAVLLASAAFAAGTSAGRRHDAGSPPSGPFAEPDPSVALAHAVGAGMRGDPAALATLRRGGAAARAACLDRVARAGDDASGALALFGRIGGVVGSGEAESLARAHARADLAGRVDLRRGIVAALAGAGGDSGVAALSRLLCASRFAVPADDGDDAAESEVVAALRDVAARGRPGLALRALRDGADAGSARAAAGTVSVGGSQEIDRLLSRRCALAASDEVAAALRAASDTARALVVRRAAAGDPRALALAAAARLEDLPSALTAALADAGAPGAARPDPTAAVAAIAAVGGAPAWRALPLLRAGDDASAARAASAAIRALPPAAASAMRALALGSVGSRAAPYLAALAEMGDEGPVALADLANRPA